MRSNSKLLFTCIACSTSIMLLGFLWDASANNKQDSEGQLTGNLSGDLPYDVDIQKVRKLVAQDDINSAHREFDVLAWKAFIALNWPSEPNGQPSKTKTIADTTAPRMWQFWRTPDTIFVPEGMSPKPWSGELQATNKFLWKSAWRQHTTAASNTEAFSGPLIDQNGKWVRYQIRVNREEFDYIVKNQLYSQDGQIQFGHRENNNQIELPVNEGNAKHGAIEIKLAWKELGPHDDASRFYTRELTSELSEPAGSNGKAVPPRSFKAGLVGMHIAMRTESSPEWIWSTFEHIDNVRSNKNLDGTSTHPNFFDPYRPQPINVLPAANAILDSNTNLPKIVTDTSVKPDLWVESLTTTPVQVQRVKVPTQVGLNPEDAQLSEVTKTINHEMQMALRAQNSVFQNYELIDTQWPKHPNALACPGGKDSAPESITHKTPGDMVPVFLVNSIMETYFQKGLQQAGSLEQDDRLDPSSPPIDTTKVMGTESCVGCHYSAGAAIEYKKDLQTGKIIVNKDGRPTVVYGENNHFGKTGNASFSWMLQLEPQPKRFTLDDPRVILKDD
jgi:hypothetical protein